jgi:hypothetical protein
VLRRQIGFDQYRRNISENRMPLALMQLTRFAGIGAQVVIASTVRGCRESLRSRCRPPLSASNLGCLDHFE